MAAGQTAFGFSATGADGVAVPLARYAGQVLLIVNTASQCGFTPQYAGLEALQRAYAGRGFTVLGFPCNQFGGQEPGSDREIAAFCEARFAVSFPVFAKLAVNGGHAAPLYGWLKHRARGVLGTAAIKWNFTKFLIGRDGQVRRRFAPTDTPESLRPAIEAALEGTPHG